MTKFTEEQQSWLAWHAMKHKTLIELIDDYENFYDCFVHKTIETDQQDILSVLRDDSERLYNHYFIDVCDYHDPDVFNWIMVFVINGEIIKKSHKQLLSEREFGLVGLFDYIKEEPHWVCNNEKIETYLHKEDRLHTFKPKQIWVIPKELSKTIKGWREFNIVLPMIQDRWC